MVELQKTEKGYCLFVPENLGEGGVFDAVLEDGTRIVVKIEVKERAEPPEAIEKIVEQMGKSIASRKYHRETLEKLKNLKKESLDRLFAGEDSLRMLMRFSSELEFEEDLFQEVVEILRNYSNSLKALYSHLKLDKEGVIVVFLLAELAAKGHFQEVDFFRRVLQDVRNREGTADLKLLLLKAFSRLDPQAAVHLCRDEFLEKKEKLDYYEFQMVSRILKEIQGSNSYKVLHGLLQGYWSSYYL